MSNPFKYRRIDDNFLAEAREQIIGGDSVVILGSRYSGKRASMNRLKSELLKHGVWPTIHLKLPRDPVATEEDLEYLIKMSIAESVQNVELPEVGRSNEILAPIDDVYQQVGKPIALLAGNIDILKYHLSRQLLEEIRERVQNHILVVVLSGEDNFRDLVYGPKSEFNCANQYVVQGFSLEGFKPWVDRYCGILNIGFADLENSVRELWKRTGGNSHLLRMLLWEIVEKRARTFVERGGVKLIEDVGECIAKMRLPGTLNGDVFKHASRLIAREPKSWSPLDQLIKDSVVSVGLGGSAPSLLELAGVAQRQGQDLRFSSPLMECYVRRTYGDRRFGDLYICNSQWDEAFDRYDRLDPEALARPSGTDDRVRAELSVRALISGLYSAASINPRSVLDLLKKGCRYVLGFPEFIIWRQIGHEWEHVEVTPEDIGNGLLSDIHLLLPSTTEVSPGVLKLAEPWDRYGLAAILPTVRTNQQAAIVVSHFLKRTSISRERERLARELLDHFVQAYSRAIEVERDRRRLERRDQQLEVMNSIFNALGSEVLNVRHALKMAAQGLRSLGYRRVLFCLVNAEGDRIQGELDDSDDPGVDVAQMTDWPLASPHADLQPYVIQTRRVKIVEDAAREPLANSAVVERAKLGAIAIVPLLNRSGDALGTIHVEREDGAVPTQDEVEDLEFFGRQLSIAVEQSERVNLLQSTLDKIPEPVLIADRKKRLRYANRPASELFGMDAGWRDRENTLPLGREHLGKLAEFLNIAIREGRRMAEHQDGIGQKSDYRGAVLADVIGDWRERNVGSILHIQGLNYLHRVLEALRLIAVASDTESAMSSILQAAKRLGHREGRLFLVDPEDPERMASRLSMTASGISQNVERLPKRSETSYRTWLCIKRRKPIVYCWNEDVPDGAKVITDFGLEAINSNPPKCPKELNKKPGDFWIDVPLITQSKTLGKLSLLCDKDLWPEEFELLKVLSNMVAGLLDAFLRRDHHRAERENLVLKGAAEQAMAVAAHNIATQLAALSVLLARYQLLESRYPIISDVNNDFTHIISEVMGLIDRVKERITSVRPHFDLIDLVSHLRHTLKVSLSDDTWRVDSEVDVIEIEADAHLLGNAFLELVENSRVLAANGNRPSIAIEIESDTSSKNEDWIRVVYTDSGPGVPKELKERIFENFFSRRPGRKTGTGLGLGFVRRVIEAHGGVIVENGDEGVGAKFVIAFPRFNAPYP